MRWPLVTRSHHDEMVAELRSQIAELKADARRWVDLFTEKATGRRLYEVPAPEPEASDAKEPAPIDEHPLARARRALGTKAKPRDIVNYFQKENNEEFAAATRTLGPPDPPKVPDDMQAAVNEGRQSAV